MRKASSMGVFLLIPPSAQKVPPPTLTNPETSPVRKSLKSLGTDIATALERRQGGGSMLEADNTKVVKEAYAALRARRHSCAAQEPRRQGYMEASHGRWSARTIGGERHGKASVAEFFRLLAEVQTFEQFEPRELIAQGNKVVTLGHYKGMPKGTSKLFESDFVMVFTLREGKVVHFQEFTDSAGVNAAVGGHQGAGVA